MSDRLKEAIYRVDCMILGDRLPLATAQTLAEAARRLLEAEEVLVCEEHDRSRAWELPNEENKAGECQRAALHRQILSFPHENPCRMVPKLLVDPQEGESE